MGRLSESTAYARSRAGLLHGFVGGLAHHVDAVRDAAHAVSESIGTPRRLANGPGDVSSIDLLQRAGVGDRLLEAISPGHLHSEHLAAARSCAERRCSGQTS